MATGYTIRQYARFCVNWPVYYMGADFLGHGCVDEISLMGWRVTGDHRVYPGMKVKLAITLLDNTTAVSVDTAVVRWARAGAFGLRILQMKPEESDRLARVVTRLVQSQTEGLSPLVTR